MARKVGFVGIEGRARVAVDDLFNARRVEKIANGLPKGSRTDDYGEDLAAAFEDQWGQVLPWFGVPGPDGIGGDRELVGFFASRRPGDAALADDKDDQL